MLQVKLDRLLIQRRSGVERFLNGPKDLSVDLLSFWQWKGSDLVSNATRGVVAEYLVALALHVDVSGVRDEWAAYDLVTPSGIKIEVKSAAFVQSWFQRPSLSSPFAPRKPSRGIPTQIVKVRQLAAKQTPTCLHSSPTKTSRRCRHSMQVTGSFTSWQRGFWMLGQEANIPSHFALSRSCLGVLSSLMKLIKQLRMQSKIKGLTNENFMHTDKII